jgi:nicotinamide-nucleotide adenylyltransferase
MAMTEDNMASRMSIYRSLVPQLASALKSFQASDSKFRILQTVHPLGFAPQEPQPLLREESPKTLFILDSSFNPPSIAHQTLALSALHKSSSDRHPKPHRFILLFATMNAEKAPSAASFEQRLTLMTILASDLLESLKHSDTHSVVPIDIGVTSLPYYTDKSHAIDTEGSHWYPSKPKHVHLVGYDTITRFFAAKYYPKFDPPLSALNPYFDAGHSLRVTLRPDDQFGNEDEQRAFVKRLEDGQMVHEGGRREWAKQVELVPPNPKSGVSSTRIRKAAKRGDWDEVKQLCTSSVAEYVMSEGLYRDDDRGAKMA